jgi:hypothetical protein
MSRHADEADSYSGLAPLSRAANLSVRTLRDRINDPVDPLPAYRVGAKILVRRSEFHDWMRRRRIKAETVDAVVDGVLRELAGAAGDSGEGRRRRGVTPRRR